MVNVLQKLKIAVVGSGISGLTAAWLLSQRHDVTVIEADARLGGHAHTVDVAVAGHGTVAIDTGFIVSNTWTYPNFSALMDYLDVPMRDTAMSFAVSLDRGRYEYSGSSLWSMLGRAPMVVDPRHWQMIRDLVRFYGSASDMAKAVPADMTLGAFLQREGYGNNFIHRHILPMAGAIWSSTPEEIAQYPFQAFARFYSNHKLFELGNRPNWRTVQGGSREYVGRLIADSRFATQVASPVTHITRGPGAVEVVTLGGKRQHFDQVVIASHGDQALRMLANPTAREVELLSVFKTSLNKVYLHRDPQLMPWCKRFWSAWNYMGAGDGAEKKLSVSYWMNALQHLQSPANHFVSLNPQVEPRADLTDGTYHYRHPLFSAATLEAQKNIWDIQGQDRIWFAGAWMGAGFHEDGAQAGLAVAEQLGGVRRPWSVKDESGRIHVKLPPEHYCVPYVDAAE